MVFFLYGIFFHHIHMASMKNMPIYVFLEKFIPHMQKCLKLHGLIKQGQCIKIDFLMMGFLPCEMGFLDKI